MISKVKNIKHLVLAELHMSSNSVMRMCRQAL